MKRTCKVGDMVFHNGYLYEVSEIIVPGEEDAEVRGKFIPGFRDFITGCRVMENGQVLRRSPVYIGGNWLPVDERCL